MMGWLSARASAEPNVPAKSVIAVTAVIVLGCIMSILLLNRNLEPISGYRLQTCCLRRFNRPEAFQFQICRRFRRCRQLERLQWPTAPGPTVGRRLSVGAGAARSVTPLPTLGKTLFANWICVRVRDTCFGLCDAVRRIAGGRDAGMTTVSGSCSTKAGFVSAEGACCR